MYPFLYLKVFSTFCLFNIQPLRRFQALPAGHIFRLFSEFYLFVILVSFRKCLVFIRFN